MITPSKVSGSVVVPPSKSFTHRAVILASLAEGKSIIRNPLFCDDIEATIECCENFGAKIKRVGDSLEIEGTGGELKTDGNFYVYDSGTTARLMASLAALAKGRSIIYGSFRLHQRPVADLLKSLNEAGIDIKAYEGDDHFPIIVDGGEFNGGIIEVCGTVSSQYVSSPLIISPFAKNDTTIKVVGGLVSGPFVAITIEMMRVFGVEVERKGKYEFFIKHGQMYKPADVTIEGDWSLASYYFAAAATCKTEIVVNGLNVNSAQGEKIFPLILNSMGCKVEWLGDCVKIKGGNLKGIEISMNDHPDIVQSLAFVAAFAEGETHIREISHLVGKETDRIKDTRNELLKMGVKVNATPSSLTIHGRKDPKGAVFEGHGDHRMVMSETVGALGAYGESIIRNADTSKSHPEFFNKMRSIGAKIDNDDYVD